MSTVISQNMVLGQAALDSAAGMICYLNELTPDGVAATSAESTSPVSNVTNPSTAFKWVATSAATQTITATLAGNELDYVGIASHNLNQIGLSVELKLNGVTVETLTNPSDNQAILFVLNNAAPTTLEIVISGATVAPKIGVIRAGKSLKLQRNIYVGHTPIVYGRQRQSINGMSESGQYLGEIVTRETLTTSVNLQNLTPDWYRNNLDPFFALKPRVPCFFAWRPADYADEVSYCWLEGNPKMSNQRSNGMVQASFNLRGIA